MLRLKMDIHYKTTLCEQKIVVGPKVTAREQLAVSAKSEVPTFYHYAFRKDSRIQLR